MTSRKRTHEEANRDSNGSDAGPGLGPEDASLLRRIRNMWQFANLCQWIFLFGKVVKIDDSVDIEMLETECLKPDAPLLKEVGLRILQFLSSHRGLTLDLFDEYTRRQYLAKAADKNPFGDGETATSFNHFTVFNKIKVLQQLTVFAMMYSDKIREKAEEPDHASWRIEPYGWDSKDRTYFVLDDNRVYRRSEPPPPPALPTAKPSKKTKAGRASLRASKRRRVTDGSVQVDDAAEAAAEVGADGEQDQQQQKQPFDDDGLGGMKWECIVVTLDELRQFLRTLEKTRDGNEKNLRDQIQVSLLPLLVKQEESRKRREQIRQKELLNLAKLATAKRSSRIAGKAERQRLEEQIKDEEKKRAGELAAARKEAKRLERLERERDERLRSRADRLQERQARRIRNEEELAQLASSDPAAAKSGPGRLSERQRQVEMEKRQEALKELENDLDDDWIFDCVCGVYGQVDDGSHSVACERCNAWQHSACVGVSSEEADRPDFHFLCSSCRRRADEAKKPATTIKLKVGSHLGSSPVAAAAAAAAAAMTASASASTPTPAPTPAVASFSPSSSLSSSSSSPTCSTNIVVEIPAAAGAVTAGSASPPPPPLSAGDINKDGLAKNGAVLPPPTEQPRPRPSVLSKLPRPSAPEKAASGGGTAGLLSSSPPPARRASAGAAVASPPALVTTLTPSNTKTADHRGFPPSTPIFSAGSPNGSFNESIMSTLPASERGVSPTKHSSPPARPASRNGSGGAAVKYNTQSAVVPPTTALAPSPQPQILTPPSKQATSPVRPPP